MYLGISIGANPSKPSTWEPIIQKLTKNLNEGKHKHLSFERRIVLINSVLLALPLFFVSFFKMTLSVIKSVVKIQREFLWWRNGDRGKIAWVG